MSIGTWRRRRRTRGFPEAREDLAARGKDFEEAGRDRAAEAEGCVGQSEPAVAVHPSLSKLLFLSAIRRVWVSSLHEMAGKMESSPGFYKTAHISPNSNAVLPKHGCLGSARSQTQVGADGDFSAPISIQLPREMGLLRPPPVSQPLQASPGLAWQRLRRRINFGRLCPSQCRVWVRLPAGMQLGREDLCSPRHSLSAGVCCPHDSFAGASTAWCQQTPWLIRSHGVASMLIAFVKGEQKKDPV